MEKLLDVKCRTKRTPNFSARILLRLVFLLSIYCRKLVSAVGKVGENMEFTKIDLIFAI